MSEKYNTKQKQIILDIVKKQGKDFSAKDIYESVRHKISLTTIYRYIDTLEAEGLVLRLSQDKNSARYQYIEPCEHNDHFYLKCKKCSKLIHIDCEKAAELTAHITKEHNFIPTDTHIIINGHCKGCAQ